MNTKLGDAEQFVAGWVFDGPDTNYPGHYFEPDDMERAVWDLAVAGAESLKERGLVEIEVAEPEGVMYVRATETWMATEGLAWNGKMVVEA